MSVALSSATEIGICKLIHVIFLIQTFGSVVTFVSVAVANAVYLILFVCFSKRYLLLKRDDIVPIHLFAEEYFEKELKGRRRQDNERLQCQMNLSVEKDV